MERQIRTTLASLGVAAHKAKCNAAVQGGVGVVATAPQPLVPTDPANSSAIVASELLDEKRWQEVYVPFQHGRRAEGLYIGNVYGDPQRDNEALFKAVLEQAMSKGDVPYVICGDFNADIGCSTVWSNALATGAWHDLAVVNGLEDRPTYCRTPTWDRESNDPHSSRIDYMIVNGPALDIVVPGTFCYVTEGNFPGHIGISVAVDISAYSCLVTRWDKPREFHVEHMDEITVEERRELAIL